MAEEKQPKQQQPKPAQQEPIATVKPADPKIEVQQRVIKANRKDERKRYIRGD